MFRDFCHRVRKVTRLVVPDADIRLHSKFTCEPLKPTKGEFACERRKSAHINTLVCHRLKTLLECFLVDTIDSPLTLIKLEG